MEVAAGCEIRSCDDYCFTYRFVGVAIAKLLQLGLLMFIYIIVL